MTFKTTTIVAQMSIVALLSACSSPPKADPGVYRVSGHYSSIGSPGKVKAYVYAGKTVVELEEPVTAARATDRNGIDHASTIEGRFVRFDQILHHFRLESDRGVFQFFLDPVFEVYTSTTDASKSINYRLEANKVP